MIPAVSVTIDGKSLKSDEQPLRVIAAEEQDVVIAEIAISRKRVYPTQPFTVTLKILVQPLPNSSTEDPLSPLQRRPPHIQINWVDPPAGLSAAEKSGWLQPLLADDGVGFTLNEVNTRSGSFFDGPRAAVLNLRKGRETRKGLDGDDIKYFTYELTRVLTPERTGVFSLGPALIKGVFVGGIERREYQGRKIVTSAPAVSVEVSEVPTPRPPTFCGGIGEYSVRASASPLKLRVGDPLTLNLELERGADSGSLELVAAPDLSAIEQLAADFDLIDKSPTGRIEGSVKKFAYALRPKRPGVRIPELTISTFNPESEEFENLKTATIPLEVAEAEKLNIGDLVGNRSSTSLSTMKSRSEGIFQNVIDPAELGDQRISLYAWTQSAVFVWCVAGVLIGLTKRYQHQSSDVVRVRRQQARSQAQHRLADARASLSKGDHKSGLKQVRSAVIGLIADLQNRVADGMTTADVNQFLSASTVPDNDRIEILKMLESIESADYGGGETIDCQSAIDSATRWITRNAPEIERGAIR